MRRTKAFLEAQRRADRTNMIHFVAYDPEHPAQEWQGRFVACLAFDGRSKAEVVQEVFPSKRGICD